MRPENICPGEESGMINFNSEKLVSVSCEYFPLVYMECSFKLSDCRLLKFRKDFFLLALTFICKIRSYYPKIDIF